MSGTEFAREKDNVAAIMRAKQAAGTLILLLLLIDLKTLNLTIHVAEAKKNEGGAKK